MTGDSIRLNSIRLDSTPRLRGTTRVTRSNVDWIRRYSMYRPETYRVSLRDRPASPGPHTPPPPRRATALSLAPLATLASWLSARARPQSSSSFFFFCRDHAAHLRENWKKNARRTRKNDPKVPSLSAITLTFSLEICVCDAIFNRRCEKVKWNPKESASTTDVFNSLFNNNETSWERKRKIEIAN